MRSPAARKEHRRSRRTAVCSGRETQSSKYRKLARKKAAAGGSRRGHRRQEGGRNSLRPLDFGAHELLRASGKSPMVERRTSVNLSPCGRRTSLGAARPDASRLGDSITGVRGRFHQESVNSGQWSDVSVRIQKGWDDLSGWFHSPIDQCAARRDGREAQNWRNA